MIFTIEGDMNSETREKPLLEISRTNLTKKI